MARASVITGEPLARHVQQVWTIPQHDGPNHPGLSQGGCSPTTPPLNPSTLTDTFLSISIETPTEGRGGVSRMIVSPMSAQRGASGRPGLAARKPPSESAPGRRRERSFC